MKLQNLTVIFIIIIIPVILLLSLYISSGLRTIKYQSLYDEGLVTATHDAIYAFEINSSNYEYANNPEIKRDILKSSVKMFEKSLCNTCGISSYNPYDIEEYIPAIVFGMYDGFYMYAPSKNVKTGKYEHSLKNYVYYSEKIDSQTTIIYSLDNYVSVTGDFGIKSGYLIVEDNWEIDSTDADAHTYFTEAKDFTEWFNGEFGSYTYLEINSDNNPEDENSAFVRHKRSIMKQKIEGVLNSTITAYANRIGSYNFKMPKLTEEDWQRIYSNISMTTFFQGKNIGLTKYNGYCVLNSTNSKEYVNPNLIYFINGTDDTDHYYHDIRCSEISTISDTNKLRGYKIGDFNKEKLAEIKNPDGTTKKNHEGNVLYDDNGTETTNHYRYNHMSLACYQCINGQLSSKKTVYEYINNGTGGEFAQDTIKKVYYTSLARERYRRTKILEAYDTILPLTDAKYIKNEGETIDSTDDCIVLAARGTVTGKDKDSVIVMAKFSFDKTDGKQVIVGNQDSSGWDLRLFSTGYLGIQIRNSDKGRYDSCKITNYKPTTGVIYSLLGLYNDGKIKIYLYDSSNNLILTNSAQCENANLGKDSIDTVIGANPKKSGEVDESTLFYGTIYNVKLWYNQTFTYSQIRNLLKNSE